jgi:hypothetical protein
METGVAGWHRVADPPSPMAVIRITTPLPEMAPFWYMLLAFPVLGMLVADLFDLWRDRGISLPTADLGLQIALIVALSSLRLGVRIPLSGHALLVAWFLFRRLRLRNAPPRQSRLEVWIAAGVLAAVAWPKLFWWDDPVTLAGIGAAALLATISRWLVAGVPPIDPDRPAGMPAFPGTARLCSPGVAFLALS